MFHQISRFVRLGTLTSLALCVFVAQVCGQDSTSQQVREYLNSGEYSVAIDLASQLNDSRQADQLLFTIASDQARNGDRLNAFSTAGLIEGDDSRSQMLGNLYSQGSDLSDNYGFGGAAGGGGGRGGARGGITAADFDELMELILETIDPDSWEENGGTGRMHPFPAGVFVDSQGTLRKVITDRGSSLDAIRQQASDQTQRLSIPGESPLRKISLTKLERALQNAAARGRHPSAEMTHLAGIYELRFVIFYPETRDIVLAGPAGPWHYDNDGRAINTETGNPVLYLDDLVICLRNAKRFGGQFGCSINPRNENLMEFKRFVDSSKLKGKAWSRRMHEIIGQQDVVVEGIDPATHTGRVLVEADYRMKLVGMGLEPAVEGLKTYYDRLHLDDKGNPPASDVVRWWFTMNYDAVESNEDRNIFQIKGQGVKLLSETEFLDEQGRRVHTGKSNLPTKGFADDFTRYFPQMAKKYPIYGELKNVFDCALAANLIYNTGLDKKVDWKLRHFDSPDDSDKLVYQVTTEAVPLTVDSVISEKVIRQRQGRTSKTHTIVGISGGVQYDIHQIAAPANIKLNQSGDLSLARNGSKPTDSTWTAWWWD